MADPAFAAPLHPDDAPFDDQSELASLGHRLFGALVDMGLTVACYVPPVLIVGLFGRRDGGDEHPAVIIGVLVTFLVPILALTALQWAFTHQRGQSLGKIAAGTRIVKVNGRPITFVEGIILRNWVLAFPTALLNQCCLGWLVTLTDLLLIFAEDRRCIHDHIAGTKVVYAD